VKPKKCYDCIYLYRHQLVNVEKGFAIVTKTGRTEQQYRCKKFDKLYFEARENCKGLYKKKAGGY
jgi:hypothetical protein